MSKSSSIKVETAFVALGAVVLACWFGYPVLSALLQGGRVVEVPDTDWEQALHLHWVPFITITHYHQFPLWDPYCTGGIPMLGDPPSAFFTPLLLLDLIFGPAKGLGYSMICHSAIAFAGGYLLARILGISRLGAVACGGTFGGSSWYYNHLELGHAGWMAYAYMPWAVAMLCLAIERRRFVFAAAGGFFMALMQMEQGHYPFLHTSLVVAALAPMLAIQRRSFLALVMLGVMVAFAAGFAAVKALPGIAYTGLHARACCGYDGWPVSFLFRWLFWRVFVTGPYHNLESHGYIGLIFGAFAILGVASRFPKTFPWLVVFMFTSLLAIGNFGQYSPWYLIHQLPFYGSMSRPARLMPAVTLAAGVMAGYGAEYIYSIAKPWGMIVAALLITMAIADARDVVTPGIQLRDMMGDQAPINLSPDFRQAFASPFENVRGEYQAAQANLGWVRCLVDILPKGVNAVGYDQTDYRGEEYMQGGGTVRRISWTPNVLSFDVDAPTSATMFVNQNYDSGWLIQEGRGEVVSINGRLAVKVPAGAQRLVMVYRSREFVKGLLITLSTLAGMILLWRIEPYLWRKMLDFER
ncbi:MAG TPA: hypothetical protein VMU16_08955 [Candidatus Binataceae bacterium]|nr:hypothetical protein [Candidatus Binataceae bacterium]